VQQIDSPGNMFSPAQGLRLSRHGQSRHAVLIPIRIDTYVL